MTARRHIAPAAPALPIDPSALGTAVLALLDLPAVVAELRQEVAELKAEVAQLRARPVSVREAAAQLGLSEPTIRRDIRKGKLKSVRHGTAVRVVLPDPANDGEAEARRLAREAREHIPNVRNIRNGAAAPKR